MAVGGGRVGIYLLLIQYIKYLLRVKYVLHSGNIIVNNVKILPLWTIDYILVRKHALNRSIQLLYSNYILLSERKKNKAGEGVYQ